MRQFSSDIAFTPAVKAVQTRKGSRTRYERVERDGWETRITPELAEFLAGLDMFYLGTASARRTAIHPVPRRVTRFPEGSGRSNPRVRRLRRQPPVPHVR